MTLTKIVLKLIFEKRLSIQEVARIYAGIVVYKNIDLKG